MSGGTRLENANPVIFQRTGDRRLTSTEEDENVHDPIDDREIFDILFNIEAPPWSYSSHHYAVLSASLWINVDASYMCFKRYKVLRHLPHDVSDSDR